MLGESKFKVLNKIKGPIKPITFLVSHEVTTTEVLKKMEDAGLTFPVIAKPDIGERGWGVEKISSETALTRYIQKTPVDFLIQEFIDLPVEVGVFYYRYPNQSKGRVSSVVIKEMLSVKGDGKTDLLALILKNDRAKLQLDHLKKQYDLNLVPDAGETMELVGIGNHCKGATFLNGNYLINQKLHDTFDDISRGIEGFYYGRFDLRCASIEALYAGAVKIMELNGAGSEPAHIYQPGFSIIEAYRVLFQHWKALFDISTYNKKVGVPYLTFKEGWKAYQKVRSYNKLKTS